MDRTTINARRECWYLLDTTWLNAWAEWVENIDGAEPPGKLSTAGLRDEQGNILKGLRPKIDYRFVSPSCTLFLILLISLLPEVSPQQFIISIVSSMGKMTPLPFVDTQLISITCLFRMSTWSPSAESHRLVQRSDCSDLSLSPFQLKARVVVNKIREKYVKWGEDEEDEVTPILFLIFLSLQQEDEWCCCGLTRDHVESILYWILTCGSRSRSGRKNIRYRDYRPLKRSTGDDDVMSEWSVRSNSTLASIESDHSRASTNTSIGDADRGYGQNSIVRNWVMGMVGYTSH